jgi:hypothetical protein
MKTITILLTSLLLTSSAYAFGDRERNAILGFGAGVLVSHMINEYHNDKRGSLDLHASFGETVVQPVRHVVHREPRYHREHHQERKYCASDRAHVKKHHRNDRHYAKHAYKKGFAKGYKKGYKKAYKKHMRKHHRADVVAVNNYSSHYYY